MFNFAGDNPTYRAFGFAIITLQIFSFIFGQPFFQSGIWYQTEPMLLALMLIGAANALWLAVGINNKWLSFVRPHPLFIFILAWGAWQVIVTISTVTTWRSWFGPPQTGMGTASYILLILMCPAIYAFWQHAYYRVRILWLAIANITIVALMHIFLQETAWSPGKWPDYIAFTAGYTWIAVMCAGACARKYLYVFAIFIIAAIYASQNSSAFIFLSAAIIVSLFASSESLPPSLQKFLAPGKAWRNVAIVACFFPMALFFASLNIDTANPKVYSNEETRHMMGGDGSLGSRVRLNKIAAEVIKNEPRRLFFGKGWGSYNDDSYKYAIFDGEGQFKDGKQNMSWMLVHGSAFHSHVQQIEALLAFGIVGFALWYAIVLAVLWTLPQRLFWPVAPVVVGLCASAGLWFELTQNLAYQAIYYVALMSLAQSHAATISIPREKYLRYALLFTCLLFAWSGWQQFRAIKYGSYMFDHIISADNKPFTGAAEWLAQDLKRDGERLRYSIENMVRKSVDRNYQKQANENDAGWYNEFLYAAQKAAYSENTGLRTASSQLWLLNNLFLYMDSEPFSKIKPEAKLYLPQAMVMLAATAPKREDLSAIFIYNLDDFTEGNKTLKLDILKRLLAINPEHRGALWVLGGMLAADPETHETGIEMQRHALEMGADRVFPITEEEKKGVAN